MCANFAASGANHLNGEKERTIDTDIIIDMLRGVRASRDYLLRFGRGELMGSISAVVVTELFAGKRTRNTTEALRVEIAISVFHVVPVTIEVARKVGELVRDYGLSLPDALIAATALLRNAVLVTRNVSDFQRIPNLKLEVPYP
ncbi:MAG: type II toxin-antitoxin system VapC family toxin [Armatimonadetes bacterium]|nr:type II toxin-antitoxin system VapC family toxin [Armatimonadota bacterium]